MCLATNIWHKSVSQNKTPTQSFWDNFGKYESISIILSLLHSTMNCGISCYIIRHLISNLLSHYTVQLYTTVIQNCDKSFIYCKYLQKYRVLDHMSVLINLQYYSMCPKYLPSARTHTLRCARHFVNGYVNDALLQCCASV